MPGIANGYAGVGLDDFGDYSQNTDGRNGGPGKVADTVAVRGSSSTQWYYLGGATNGSGQPASLPFDLWTNASSRPSQGPTVTVTLTPQGTLSVAIDDNTGSGSVTYYTQSIVGVNGEPAVPANVYLGFTTANGGATAYHQINDLTVATQAPPGPYPYPFVDGDQFNYSYSDDTVTTGSSSSSTPVYTSLTGTETTTIGNNATFKGKASTEVTNVLETSKKAGGVVRSQTVTADAYEAFVSTGRSAFNYDEYGNDQSTTVTTNGKIRTTTSNETNHGPKVLDELPETAGQEWREQGGFSNSDSSQISRNGKVTSESNGTYARKADGQYMSSVTTSAGKSSVTDKRVQKSDGSGTDTNSGTGSTGGTTTFGLPAPIGSSYYIPVTHQPAGGSATTTQVPDWYPGNGPIPTLFTNVATDLGPAAIPGSCPNNAGSTAQDLNDVAAFLDVIAGTYTQETTDTYVIYGEGVVCIVDQTTTTSYDNLSTGKLLSTVQGTQVTSLTSETLYGSSSSARRHKGRS